MGVTPKKKITEIKAEEWRQERAENRRAFSRRLWGVFRFLLVMTIFAVAFNHRTQIQKICHVEFGRAMKHVTLPPQTRQKSIDYQRQLDDVTTN
jgi:hypothetical protein